MTSDLDELAAEALDRPETRAPDLTALQDRVARRRRIRRTVLAVMVAPLVLGAALGGWVLLRDGESDGSVATVTPPTEAHTETMTTADTSTSDVEATELIAPVLPNLVGLEPFQAGAIVDDLGLTLESEIIDPAATRSTPLIVERMEPAAGSVFDDDTTVRIYLARDPARIDPDAVVVVPELLGRTRGGVEATLDLSGLGFTVVDLTPDDDIAGLVIDVDPAAGTEVEPGTQVTVTISSNMSQSFTDAERDGVVPLIAAFPNELRLDILDPDVGDTTVETTAGTFVVSRPDPDRLAHLAPGCGLGDPTGEFGRDIVCLLEYAEILLLDRDGRIVRAYPFPSVPPRSLVVAGDALYCIRQGDGGLPASMLCRIDLTTLEATVRVFPSALESEFDQWTPPYWTVDAPTDLVVWERLEIAGDTVTISGWSGTATVDPATLELLTLDLADTSTSENNDGG